MSKIVDIKKAKEFMKSENSPDCVLTVSFFKRKKAGYTYRVNKNKKIKVTDEVVIHCLSKVFGDILAYSGDPSIINEAIDNVASRFYDTDFIDLDEGDE